MNPMNQDHPNDGQEAVRRALQEWAVTAPLPPRFAEEVWRRIEQAEPAAPAALLPSVWDVAKAWLVRTLPRPAFAVSYISVLLIAGLVAGYWHARVDTASWDQLLASRYVQAVDPFVRTAHD
jgi:hypothetical protein